MKNKFSGQFANGDASAADLDRGFIADDSRIHEVGDNVCKPAPDSMRCCYFKDDDDFTGGFLGRDNH